MTQQVVVVGGGYAGVLAANRVTRRRDVEVTLVNPRPWFVERIRLHQLAAGTHEALVAHRDVLAPSVRVRVGTATRIDAGARRVLLADGTTLGYDHLVYAAGSVSGVPAVPGAAEHAHPLGDLEQARRLRAALDAAPPTAPVTVVGAGPSGIETAAELAEQGRRVRLLCGDVLGPYLHPANRDAVARRLERLGVLVLAGPGTSAAAVGPDRVELDDGRTLPSAVTIWTAGFAVPDLARRSGLSTDTVGRLLTDETLTSVDDDRIVAAGDSAAPSGRAFRMSCQAAGQLGLHAAGTVVRRLAGEEPAPVRVGFVGQCLSLGRHDGFVQLAGRDDEARRAHLDGWAGARVKELVCRGTVSQLRFEARHPGAYAAPRWTGDPGRPAALEAARSGTLVR